MQEIIQNSDVRLEPFAVGREEEVTTTDVPGNSLMASNDNNENVYETLFGADNYNEEALVDFDTFGNLLNTSLQLSEPNTDYLVDSLSGQQQPINTSFTPSSTDLGKHDDQEFLLNTNPPPSTVMWMPDGVTAKHNADYKSHVNLDVIKSGYRKDKQDPQKVKTMVKAFVNINKVSLPQGASFYFLSRDQMGWLNE